MIQIINGVEVEMSAEEQASFEAGRAAISIGLAPVASVSARQFKLQLLALELLDEVEGWVAAQSRAVQIAFEYSGTFVRGEPMMAQGFVEMGFTGAQVDAFFEAASKL